MKELFTLVGFLSLIACGNQEELLLTDAWIRLSPPTMQMTAGYLTIANPNSENRTLVRVSSPKFSSIEIHRTQTDNGTARMVEQKTLLIPAGGSVSFEPGGLHLMLMGFEKPLIENQEIDLTFHWSDGYSSFVAAIVSRQAP